MLRLWTCNMHVERPNIEKDCKELLAKKNLPLLAKDDFPVDIDALVELFRSLCEVGRTANSHMATEIEKIDHALAVGKLELA